MIEIISVKNVAELEAHHKSGLLTGLFEVPNDAYHAGPGISSTGLKKILESPAHYQAHKNSPQKKTTALVTGNLIHLATLEPELFKNSTVVSPKYGKSKADLAEKEAFYAANKDKEIISAKDHKAILDIALTIRKNKLAAKLLSGEFTEISVYWNDEKTGVLCKARADHINGDTIIDLKSTTNASPRAFQYHVEDYQYHISAAHYLTGFKTVLPVELFAWLAVEKSSPYGCRFYAADSQTIETGLAECARALEIYAECLAKNKWPGYPMQFETISIRPKGVAV
jgi:exodeoxyribonuclease VIII